MKHLWTKEQGRLLCQSNRPYVVRVVGFEPTRCKALEPKGDVTLVKFFLPCKSVIDHDDTEFDRHKSILAVKQFSLADKRSVPSYLLTTDCKESNPNP